MQAPLRRRISSRLGLAIMIEDPGHHRGRVGPVGDDRGAFDHPAARRMAPRQAGQQGSDLFVIAHKGHFRAGPSIVPSARSTTRAFRHDALAILDYLPVALVWRRERNAPPAARTFIEFVRGETVMRSQALPGGVTARLSGGGGTRTLGGP